jgi:hypothetical protein
LRPNDATWFDTLIYEITLKPSQKIFDKPQDSPALFT